MSELAQNDLPGGAGDPFEGVADRIAKQNALIAAAAEAKIVAGKPLNYEEFQAVKGRVATKFELVAGRERPSEEGTETYFEADLTQLGAGSVVHVYPGERDHPSSEYLIEAVDAPTADRSIYVYWGPNCYKAPARAIFSYNHEPELGYTINRGLIRTDLPLVMPSFPYRAGELPKSDDAWASTPYLIKIRRQY